MSRSSATSLGGCAPASAPARSAARGSSRGGSLTTPAAGRSWAKPFEGTSRGSASAPRGSSVRHISDSLLLVVFGFLPTQYAESQNLALTVAIARRCPLPHDSYPGQQRPRAAQGGPCPDR